MKINGLWLQIRMETPESIPEVILNGERIELIQLLELSVSCVGERNLDDVKFRIKHYEKAEERGTKLGGCSEEYLESAINAPRYKERK